MEALKVARGTTRTVLLFGNWVLKVPTFSSWSLFLQGLLGNLQEGDFSRTGWPELCPVLGVFPGGFALVMYRARPLTDAEWHALDPETWVDRGDYVVPVELKRDSFGVLRGKVVAVDYGS